MSHIQESQGWSFPLRLRDLLETFNGDPRDVDLFHADYDEESATMVDLSLNDFTEEGLKEFKIVLDTKVVRVEAMGGNWISVYVDGVDYSQIESLALSHAGYCLCEDYDRWFTMNQSDQKN